jgi:Rieske Fe-S protein
MRISRRDFVQGTLAASGLLAIGCGNGVKPAALAEPVTIFATPGDRHFGMVMVPASGYEELLSVGGSITVPIVPPQKGALPFTPPDAILLIHQSSTDSPEFVAFDSKCPHAGCPLGYSSLDQLIECPCHSSRFFVVADPMTGRCPGDVAHLPAMAPLRSYTVTVEDDQLFIDLHRGDNTQPTIKLELADHPELKSVGGFKVIVANAGPCGGSDPVIVIRKDADTVIALDARCTHAGCTVAFQKTNNDLECRCHGSTFALSGTVTHSPATLPLKKYAVTFDGTSIVIDLS